MTQILSRVARFYLSSYIVTSLLITFLYHIFYHFPFFLSIYLMAERDLCMPRSFDLEHFMDAENQSSPSLLQRNFLENSLLQATNRIWCKLWKSWINHQWDHTTIPFFAFKLLERHLVEWLWSRGRSQNYLLHCLTFKILRRLNLLP